MTPLLILQTLIKSIIRIRCERLHILNSATEMINYFKFKNKIYGSQWNGLWLDNFVISLVSF